MKILFFLVVIANVALFMWEFKTGAFMPARVAQTADGQEPIVLLSELKPESKTVSEPVSPEKSEALQIQCYEAGPFPDQSGYQHWLGVMAGQYAVESISKDEQTAGRYIVSAPASTSKETAATVQLLKMHGITDFFIRRTGDSDKEISLGVFSSEGRAAILQKQMLAKGITAKIKTEFKIKSQQYLLIRTDNKSTELLTSLQKTYPAITVKNSECR